MLPTIPPDREVLLACGKEWEAGSIVAFVDARRLIVHRIVAVSPDRRWVVTRGDHRILPDEPFEAKDAVIGVITRIREGDSWSPPAAVTESWLQSRVLRWSLRAFDSDVERCRRRLRLTGAILRLPRRAFSKALRLMHLKKS